jgi:hypothetical protein
MARVAAGFNRSPHGCARRAVIAGMLFCFVLFVTRRLYLSDSGAPGTTATRPTQIDVVIPWSGPVRPGANNAEGRNLARDRDNQEMRFLLRSVARNANWVGDTTLALLLID